jgi:hypothetical protein
MAEVREINLKAREKLAALLDPRSAGDAIVAYYALQYPMERVKILGYFPKNDRMSGFLINARTGIDLFKPLVIPFVATQEGLDALIQTGLQVRHPVMLHIPLGQASWIGETLALDDIRKTELFRLDPHVFEPRINVLITETSSPNGSPRYEILSRKGDFAAAGVNWRGDRYAEIYLEADRKAQEREFASSVLAALAARLLHEGLIPLYRRADSALLSRSDLTEVGFRATGTRTLIAQALRLPEAE